MALLGGIIGLISKMQQKDNIKKAIEMLSKLSHLGYDGTGLAAIDKQMEFKVRKIPREFSKFSEILGDLMELELNPIIGEIRFATHGRPSLENTPPLSDCKETIYVVMEGVIREYVSKKEDLLKKHHIFDSRNDAELIAHTFEEELQNNRDPEKALLNTANHLNGSYAGLIISKAHPDSIFLIVNNSKIYIGREKEKSAYYIASEVEAISNYISEYLSLDKAVAIITASKLKVKSLDGKKQDLSFQSITILPSKYTIPGGYRFFMEREIYESPLALKKAMIVHQEQYLELISRMILGAEKIYLIGAGTSYHAALLGGYILRELAGISANVIDSTEFPYYALKDVTPGTVIIALSQSGKSTDIIRAISKAKMYGASIIGILNQLGSPLMYASNLYLPIGVGLEHAVPATKSFLGQLLALYKITFKTAEMNAKVSKEEIDKLWSIMHTLPSLIDETISTVSETVKKIANKLYEKNSMYVSSRGLNFPIALEGALKIKEVSYIHAEGVEAGMLRHGPKAVIDNGFPVITIMPYERDAREDTYSLIREVKDLGADVVIITDVEDMIADKLSENVIKVPKISKLFTPFLNVIPLQLLAFHLGMLRKTPIDAPRGLLKYVVL